MAKINLTAKDWCELVFEGRNKDYGAYRMRAQHGRRQLRAVVLLIAGLASIILFILAKNAVQAAIERSNLGDNEQVTEMSDLKTEEPKKEEKKIEKPKEIEQPKAQEVQVRNTIQMVVPKIVDDDQVDHSKEMKSQKELKDSKAAIGIQNVFTGSDQGKFTEDLQQGQVASNRNTPPVAVEQKVETKVVDNAVVDVPASFPGGDAALRQFIAKNTVYPEIAIEQGLQGTVILRFKVDVDGSVSTVSVKKSLSRECDKAAMDVFRKLPKFTPAKTNGHPVPVWFTMPVKFAIQ